MLANFIPPKDREDFEGYIDLMWDRHDGRLGKNVKHRKHVQKNYLNKNPCRLGGRAAGIPGQSGSNNAGESRFGRIKAHWGHITKRLGDSAKRCVIFILAAVVMDLMLCPNASEFAWRPVRTITDYDLLRKINKFDLEGGGSQTSDVQYMACSVHGSHTEFLNLSQVTGDKTVPFTFHMPTGSYVLTSLRTLEEC